MIAAEIRLKKQPQKFLASVDARTRQKLWNAIDDIRELRGNIARLAGTEDLFRYKLEHYRIIFTWRGSELIIIETIDTRTNIKYRRYQS